MLTREQIEDCRPDHAYGHGAMDSWIPTPERLNALCDAALQVEAAEKSVEYWREQTSNANKQAEAMENDMMFARCQVEAMREELAHYKRDLSRRDEQVFTMREAIRRAVDDLDTWLFVTSNKNDRITATIRRVRADLEQALNERKDEE